MGRKGTHADPTGNAATKERHSMDMHQSGPDFEQVNLNEAGKRRLMVTDIDAKKYYSLPKHNVRCLEAGDKYVIPHPMQLPGQPLKPGKLVTVTNVDRKRQGGKIVTLGNGYSFDVMNEAHDDHDVTIYRPRKGF